MPKQKKKDIMETLLPEEPSGGVSLFRNAAAEMRYWLIGGEAPKTRDPRWMIRDDQEDDFEIRRKDPKPYAWDEPISIWKSSFSPVKRRKFWRILFVSVVAVILASMTIKAITFKLLTHLPPSFISDMTFNSEVNSALAQQERIIHYQELMGHIAVMSPDALADKLRALGESLQLQHREDAVRCIANRISDTLVLFGMLYVASAKRLKISKQVRYVKDAWQKMRTTTRTLLLLFISDFLVGFHSAHMWCTVLKMVGDHYGIQMLMVGSPAVHIFISTVPVAMDTAFKFWVFMDMRSKTKVLMEEIDG